MLVLRSKMFCGFALAVSAIMSLPSNLHAASVNSGTQTVNLTATLNESLSLSITGGNVTFSLTNGTSSAGSGPVAMTTSWVLLPSRTSVKVYGYFANAAQALTDGYTAPDYIASSSVLGQVTTGSPTSFTAFTQTNAGFGAASASLLLLNQTISLTPTPNFVGTRTDNLNLQISTPAALPAGTYTGTLTLQAQAN